jgi:2-polyprenyl-6-methoxyphenol hydroxylase-like FAD-dependent oxidoreductase
VAGLSAALRLARDGHRVTLVERDELTFEGASDAFSWTRSGVPHFHQPHAFGPGGRSAFRQLFPDVLAALRDAGAWDLDLRPKLRGVEPEAADEELAYFAARRPLIEWGLRRAIAGSGVTMRAPLAVTGLIFEDSAVRGVVTAEGPLRADVVVDALGRRTPTPSWLEALGIPAVARETDCGITYYSRYYRLNDGAKLAEGPWLPSPRGDLGYAAFSSFPGDNGTFAAVLAVPPREAAWKSLRHVAGFNAAVAMLPALRLWTDVATPITDVLPMAGLRNVLRAQRGAHGLVAIGDAICHTDPALALGLTLALLHVRALSDALGKCDDDRDALAATEAAMRPILEERFDWVSAIDAARTRSWAGERVDFARREGGAYELFSLVAGGAAALADGEVLRCVVRRNTLLAPLALLDDDVAMQGRIERIFGEMMRARRGPPGPGREEFATRLAAAVSPPTAA